jgi:uncharacterized protein with HEPN domain
MRRNYLLYLEDILASITKILTYVGDTSLKELRRDDLRIDAIIRNLEIIGEASGRMPQEIKDKYSSVEWRKISDFRNVMAHEYFGIDYKIMWDVIKNKLPTLLKEIEAILEQDK